MRLYFDGTSINRTYFVRQPTRINVMFEYSAKHECMRVFFLHRNWTVVFLKRPTVNVYTRIYIYIFIYYPHPHTHVVRRIFILWPLLHIRIYVFLRTDQHLEGSAAAYSNELTFYEFNGFNSGFIAVDLRKPRNNGQGFSSTPSLAAAKAI